MTQDLLTSVSPVQEIKFSFFYCMFSFWSSGLLVLVSTLSEGVEAFGSVLHSPQFLVLAAAYELGKVWLAKILSGHSESLSLHSSETVDSNRPIRGPFLRKVWIKSRRLLQKLSPVFQLVKGFLLLACCWVVTVYITVCFGAPVLSHWWETGTFCVLLVQLTAYPCLLALGPSSSSLHSVWVSREGEAGLLPHTLLTNSACCVLGAWLGALPLPLDWDRPWQAWPLTSCLGAVAGHVVSSVLGAARVWPKLHSLNSKDKRKFV